MATMAENVATLVIVTIVITSNCHTRSDAWRTGLCLGCTSRMEGGFHLGLHCRKNGIESSMTVLAPPPVVALSRRQC